MIKSNHQNIFDESNLEYASPLETIMESEHPSREVYHALTLDKNIIENLCKKWYEKYQIHIDQEEIKASLKMSKLTDIIKYHSFLYRLLHQAILLNDRLYHLKIVDSDWCKNSKETYYHFFYECQFSKTLWSKISQRFNILNQLLTFKNIILNSVVEQPSNSYINLLILVVKQNMYAAKCLKKKPTIRSIVQQLFFIRWFKFTLKPPNRITGEKLRLTIWDTSFWTFWVKFGHNGP